MLNKIIKQIKELNKKFTLFRNDFDKVDKERLNFNESFKKLDELKKMVEKVDVSAAFSSALSSLREEFKKIEFILTTFLNTKNYRETYEEVFTGGGLKEILNDIEEIISEVSDVKGDKKALLDDIDGMISDMKYDKEDLSKKAVVRRVMAGLRNNNL